MSGKTDNRILIVEDEIIIAMDIQNTLHTLGYTNISIAESGEEAISIMEENMADLILMDIGLRGNYDGIQTAQKILEHFSRAKIMFITSYSNLKVRESAEKIHHFGYILKPFSTDTLGNAVIQALSV
jgi:DNA-binding NarL/FixJ family response regulator